MTKKLRYKLDLGVENGADVEEIEELMQDVLLELYDQGEVETIKVTKDGYVTSEDDDVERVVEILDLVSNDDIRSAIDSVKRM